MADVQAFQNAMMSDAEVQAEFAKDPRSVLERYGLTVPEGMQLPDSISLPELQERIGQVKKGLEDQNTTIEEIAAGGSSAVTKFVEESMSLSKEEIEAMESVQEEFEEDVAAFTMGGVGGPRQAGTWAVVVGVVVALGVVVSTVVGPDTTDTAQIRR